MHHYGSLRRYSTRKSISGAGEGEEERIPLGVHFMAAPLLGGGPQEASVLREDVCVAITQLLEKTRGPLDVGEEEGDRPGGQARH